MAKAGNDARIEKIMAELRKGSDRKDILRKFSKSFNVTPRTFDNLIKKAKDALSVENKAKEEARINAATQSTINAVNEAIVSDLELEGILCVIATGNIKVEEIVKGGAILRGVTPFEQITAIDKLFKKRGTYAPVKSANTDAKGNDVVPFTDGQVEKLIKALRENKAS